MPSYPKTVHIGSTSIIDENVYIGENVWIGDFVHIRHDVYIGDGSEIRDHCFIANDVVIGKNSRIYQFSNVGMGTRIGNNVFFGVRSSTTNDKELHWPDKSGYVPDPVIIEDGVRMGFGVIVLPGITLAKNCRIGAGAVVTRNTKSGKTYVGIPAREMK